MCGFFLTSLFHVLNVRLLNSCQSLMLYSLVFRLCAAATMQPDGFARNKDIFPHDRHHASLSWFITFFLRFTDVSISWFITTESFFLTNIPDQMLLPLVATAAVAIVWIFAGRIATSPSKESKHVLQIPSSPPQGINPAPASTKPVARFSQWTDSRITMHHGLTSLLQIRQRPGGQHYRHFGMPSLFVSWNVFTMRLSSSILVDKHS